MAHRKGIKVPKIDKRGIVGTATVAETGVAEVEELPISDDVSAEFIKDRKEKEIIDLIEWAESRTEKEEPEEEAAEGDPLSIRVGKDIGYGSFEATAQVIGGVRDAVQETMEAVDSFAEWLNDEFINLRLVEKEKQLRFDLPEVGEAETVTGGLVRGISQFLTGFIPALKVVKVASGGAKAKKLGQLAQIEGAAAVSSALVFDPHESRLSDLIEEFPSLRSPVTAYLESDPKDTQAEGRFKSAVESLFVGPVLVGLSRGFVRAIKVLKKSRERVGLKKQLEEAELIKSELGDPQGKFITDEAAEIFLKRKKDIFEFLGTAKAPPLEMNFAKFLSGEGVEEAINSLSKLISKKIDLARRGKLSDDALKSLARNLNMTPEELLKRQPKFSSGTGKEFGGLGVALNAEQIIASKMILDASANMLIKMSNIARQSTDLAVLADYRRMVNIHSALQMQMQGAASEAGRALRALQIPVGSRAKQISEITELLMRDGGPDQVRRLAEVMSGIKSQQHINAVIKGSVGKRMADMIVEAWYFSLLSGPQTHAVNITTSAINTVWQMGERAFAAQWRKLIGGTGVEVGEATQMAYGVVESFGDAIRLAGKTLRTGEPSDILGKVETRQFKAISARNFGMDGVPGSLGHYMRTFADGIGQFIRIPTRFLMTEDEFFRTLGKSASTKALALRQGVGEGLEGKALAKRIVELVENPSNLMLEEALDFSRSLTFTTPLGQTGRQFQTFTNRHPALKFILPFIRTPVNLIKFAGTRSPLAPMAQSFRQAIAKGGAESDLAIARMVMGSGLMMVMVDQALKGNVTGAGPANRQLNTVWRLTNQPFSIKSGDTWYSYNRTDPFGLIIGAAASFAEIFGKLDDETAGELVAAMALAASKSVFNKTWMRGPADFLDAMTQPDIYAERWIEQNIGSLLVPAGSAQIARVVDPVWREVNSITDAIKARVPNWSKTLPPRRNIWGEPILLEGGLGPDIVSPIYKYGIKDSPIDTYILDNKIGISMPSKTQFDMELEPEEFNKFLMLSGNGVKSPSTGLGLKETLDSILAGRHSLSGLWNRSTDGEEGGRSIIIRSQIQAFRALARAEMLQDTEFRNKVEKRAREKADAIFIGPQGR